MSANNRENTTRIDWGLQAYFSKQVDSKAESTNNKAQVYFLPKSLFTHGLSLPRCSSTALPDVAQLWAPLLLNTCCHSLLAPCSVDLEKNPVTPLPQLT